MSKSCPTQSCTFWAATVCLASLFDITNEPRVARNAKRSTFRSPDTSAIAPPTSGPIIAAMLIVDSSSVLEVAFSLFLSSR
jgi:hypothetical protein